MCSTKQRICSLYDLLTYPVTLCFPSVECELTVCERESGEILCLIQKVTVIGRIIDGNGWTIMRVTPMLPM